MIQFVQSSPGGLIRTLLWIRLLLLAALLIVVLASTLGLGLMLPVKPLAGVFLLLIAWCIASYWRLGRPWVATQLEVFLNLVIDSTLFTALMYWTGGATNPFVSLYLMPIVIAAAALPATYVWAIAALCISFYSWLMFHFVPLASTHHLGGDFNLHVFGMWLNFILSAVLCGIFVAGIAAMLRRREDALGKAREEALRDEQIFALGTLAAGVAHEMNTPLATMSLVVDDLDQQASSDPDYAENIAVLKRQIDTCKTRLTILVESATNGGLESKPKVALSRFLEKTFGAWRIVRPEIDLQVSLEQPFFDPEIPEQQTISQSIANLLNNAADASVQNGSLFVRTTASSTSEEVVIVIDDDGVGVSEEQLQLAGHAVFSTKAEGLGIGFLLSNASIGRFGGSVILKPREEGGTRTEIRLPHKTLGSHGN